jgi:hypothetical protein
MLQKVCNRHGYTALNIFNLLQDSLFVRSTNSVDHLDLSISENSSLLAEDYRMWLVHCLVSRPPPEHSLNPAYSSTQNGRRLWAHMLNCMDPECGHCYLPKAIICQNLASEVSP